jgi:hypothetical protein
MNALRKHLVSDLNDHAARLNKTVVTAIYSNDRQQYVGAITPAEWRGVGDSLKLARSTLNAAQLMLESDDREGAAGGIMEADDVLRDVCKFLELVASRVESLETAESVAA